MTKLETILQSWNKEAIDYYSTVLDTLKEHDIVTAQSLLEMDTVTLCKVTKISKQVMTAFRKQVILSTMKLEEKEKKGVKRQKTTLQNSLLATGLINLDNSLGGGIYTSQIVEIVGATAKERFTMHILNSFISTYHADDAYVFDATGMFEPRSIKSTNAVCTQLLDLNHFYVSLDNLTTLFAMKDKQQTSPSFVLIYDISMLITDWTKIDKLVDMLKTLATLNCMIVILNTITDFTSSPLEAYWNPIIDIRLFVDKENQIKIVKSRQQKTIK